MVLGDAVTKLQTFVQPLPHGQGLGISNLTMFQES